MMLLGEYHVGIGPDGGMVLPSAWRGYPEGDDLRARFSFEGSAVECISAKDDVARSEKGRIEMMQAMEGEVASFREVDPIAVPVSDGSVIVPAEMRKKLGITDEAVLVGAVQGFWIWRPDAWNLQCEGVEDELTEAGLGFS